MEYSADNLEKAVTLFYRTEAVQQAEAHQWLTEAQNSPLAWSFVWELLNPHRSPEVQFFAATTLHTKLMKHWNEIPEDHYEILKKRILDYIISYANGPKIVLNRLCIALSAYIIHTVPNHWPEAFEELVSSFQPQYLPNVEPERVIWILLEILTVIPEEFQRTTLALNQRNSVRNVLQKVSKDIMKVVEMCLMPIPEAGKTAHLGMLYESMPIVSNETLKKKNTTETYWHTNPDCSIDFGKEVKLHEKRGFLNDDCNFNMGNLTTYLNASRCASAWIQLGGVYILDCTSINNLLIDLTCFVYWNKSDPEGLSCDEMDLIEITVEALTAVFQLSHAHQYKSYVFKYAAQILPKFDKILDVERNQQDMNKDVVATLYGLVITMGDAHSRIFIDNLKSENPECRQVSFDLLNFVLKCSNLPGFYPIDESSSTLTFGFWYTLQEDILSLDTPECASLMLMIKPYYRDLVCIMLRKSMFPLVEDSNWTLEDKEMFRCYRQDIADTFMYCYVVLNLEMLDILMTKLNEALRIDNSSVAIQWNEVETVLHAFGAVAESIEYENLYLPKLMSTIKDIPFKNLHVRVMATALDTVGAFSEWFMDHPDLLENIFPLILSGLNNPEVSTNATMALKDFTQNCQKYLAPYADHILLTSQVVLQIGSLKLAERKRLMYSIGRVLSTLSVDRIMFYLNMILESSFEDLQKCSEAQPSPAVSNSLVTRLKLISALFSSLHIEDGEKKVEQPVLVVMQKMMPLFRTIGEKYCRNVEVMEDLSIVFKYGVSTLKDDCKPLINDILQLIVTIYRECPQPNVLIVAKTVLILFGKEDDCCTLNQQLLFELSNTTMQMCAQFNATNQLSDKSDVLDAYFAMLAALAKKVPLLITSCGIDIAALFQCAILCLVLPEIQALKQISSFLVQFITQSRETSLAQVIQAYGESLVLRILMNLGTTAPRSSVDIFSDILLALNKKYCDNLSRWLNALLSQEGFPSPKISAPQKDAFIKSILREKTSKRKVRDTVLEFTLICKGILKPE